jgi:hypothetical protein
MEPPKSTDPQLNHSPREATVKQYQRQQENGVPQNKVQPVATSSH